MNDYEALEKLNKNIKKSINNKISDETLRKKRELNEKLFRSVETFLSYGTEYIPYEDSNIIYKNSKKWKFETESIIKHKLEELKLANDNLTCSFRVAVLVTQFCLKLKTKINRIMPTVDIKLGTALVNTFDGSPEKLDSFLDAVALFSDAIDIEYANATAAQKAAAQITLVRFVKTRLTGIARQAIGQLNDLQEILDAIKLRCAPKITSDSLLAKLRATKQTSTTENLCDSIEKLTGELKYAYISEQIPLDTAEKMATKRGVEA